MACGAQLGTDYGLRGVEASVCLGVARRRRDAELKIEVMLLTVNITGYRIRERPPLSSIPTIYI